MAIARLRTDGMEIVVILLLLLFFTLTCHAAFDVDEKDLQFLSHHLTDHQCKQLIEALRSEQLFLSDIPDGTRVGNSTCISLLEKWNMEESRGQSFVRLAERLRELQLNDLAALISRTVLKDREKVVNELILDQLTTLTPNIESDDTIVLSNPRDPNARRKSHLNDFDGRTPEEKMNKFALPDWTLAQTLLVMMSSVMIIGLLGVWFVSCVPDCCRSLCDILKRKPHRNTDDATHFLLKELADPDT